MSFKVINLHQLSPDLIFGSSPKSSGVEAVDDKTVIAFSVRQKEQVESNEITCEIFGWMTKRKVPE